MVVLNLVLYAQYFDLIKSGRKKEEYRDITSYYANKLMAGGYFETKEDLEDFVSKLKKPSERDKVMKEKGAYFRYGNNLPNDYTHIRFYRGHTGMTMLVEVKGIEIQDKYFVIKLGKIVDGKD